MEIKSAEFAFTAVDEAGFARSRLPEIALIGRSNVGKSSLINALCRKKGLARVSSSPGKTREINYYLLNGDFYLVDLPGYGYAAVSHAEQRKWAAMTESYFSRAQNLKLALFLLDIRREPSREDLQAAYWIEHNAIPYRLIATKADKVTKAQRADACRALSDKLQATFRSEAICFSVVEKLGRGEALRAMGEALRQDIK
jgi:GTP-binding protein